MTDQDRPELRWSTHSEEEDKAIGNISRKLEDLVFAYHGSTGEPKSYQPLFLTEQHIEDLTYDEAVSVIREARRMMLFQALQQETHEHWLDDCGDYLTAATENWHSLWTVYFDNDGDPETVVAEVKRFLMFDLDYPEYGSDGEIRFWLIEDALLERLMDRRDEQERLAMERNN